MSSSEKGDIKNVCKLLDKSLHADLIADVNCKDKNDNTALHFACFENKSSICQILLEK